jgi:adenylosuccinate synthase
LSEIRVCTGYRYRGRLLDSFPPDLQVLMECQPEYETLPGWDKPTAGIREFDDLPLRARDYLKRLSEHVRAEISLVSTGPERAQTIVTSPHSFLSSLLTSR